MKILVLAKIDELAQDFLKAPRIEKRNETRLGLTIDYEVDSGEYSEKSIWFDGVRNFKHTPESKVTADMVHAYNSICEVVDSDWVEDKLRKQGHKHYIIYFDGFGAFEINATSFQL